jgi:hypothetical protein
LIEESKMTDVQKAVGVELEAPGYVKLTAVLALSLALVAYIVPVLGVLAVTPFTIVLGCIALYGGDFKYLGVATIVLIVVNLMISPTFWLNVAAGATDPGAAANRFLTYFDIGGVIVMLVLLVYGKKRTA